ncbi:MAG TPA: four helix bundle protein [Chthoniobacterales bacterium]|nr:four helix bundle protein [Chthoniobacterales bacterium]
MKSFEDLEVWQRSCALSVEICAQLRTCNDYGLRDQLVRSSISLPSNIAEGAERFSQKEFMQFLGYAKGSAGEMRTQIIIANKLGYFDAAMTQLWIQELKEISAMIFGLARSLGKELQPNYFAAKRPRINLNLNL